MVDVAGGLDPLQPALAEGGRHRERRRRGGDAMALGPGGDGVAQGGSAVDDFTVVTKGAGRIAERLVDASKIPE